MKKKALSFLLSLVLISGMVTLAIPSMATAAGSSHISQRIYGGSRYDTALAAAQEKAAAGLSNIIVASGQNYPDALSGSYLAKKKDAPILLVDGTSEEKVKSFIDSNLPAGGKVYLLGGESCVSRSFENALGDKAVRLAGKGRIDTNLAILKEAGVDSSEQIIGVTAFEFADALSAAATGKPIMLLSGDSLTPEQVQAGYKPSYIIGGPAVVSENIRSASGATRIYGKSRYETSAKIAKQFFPSAGTAVLAYGAGFPDGLSGAPMAFMNNAPIILAFPGNMGDAAEYVKLTGMEKALVMGGPTLVTDATVDELWGITPAQPEPTQPEPAQPEPAQPSPGGMQKLDKIVGSKSSTSKVYHVYDCGHLPKVENRIYYASEDEAVAAGRRRCQYCQ